MKKILVLVILILIVAVVSGCLGGLLDEKDDNDETTAGKIMGTITDQNFSLGSAIPIKVMVIKEDPTADGTDLDNLTVVAETKVDNDSYSIGGIAKGEYYVIAYKDLNGNGEIDFSTTGGPIDTAGYYGLSTSSETPAKVVVKKDETATGIDFIIVSEAVTNSSAVEGSLGNINEEAVAGAAVKLYGTAGIKLAEATTDSEGAFSFAADKIVEGEYYLETVKTGYLSGLSPYFEVTNTGEIVWSGTSQGVYSFNGVMLTKIEAESFGYTEGTGIIGGGVGLMGGSDDSGVVVSLDPANGDIGYMTTNDLDYSLTETQADGGFAIKDVPPGNYTITAAKTDYLFPTYKLKIEADKMTFLALIGQSPK